LTKPPRNTQAQSLANYWEHTFCLGAGSRQLNGSTTSCLDNTRVVELGEHTHKHTHLEHQGSLHDVKHPGIYGGYGHLTGAIFSFESKAHD
jgi:hypothetical protein